MELDDSETTVPSNSLFRDGKLNNNPENEFVNMSDRATSNNTGMSASINPHFYVNNCPHDYLSFAVNDGVDEISVMIAPKDGNTLPQSNPKKLKEEIVKLVEKSGDIDTLKMTRQGKILLVTTVAEVAQKALKIQQIFNTPVEAYVIKENITTRFLLHDMDTTISCIDIAEELEEQGIVAIEVRRFLRKNKGDLLPTPTILVTKLGTHIPQYVKLWYQRHKLALFWDKPRPCLNCFKFNHGTKVCKKEKVCVKCGGNHTSECKETSLKCSNCNGAHSATDKSCPHYLREVKLQKFKSLHHLTIGEARRRFSNTEEEKIKSYAGKISSAPTPLHQAQNLVTKDVLEATMLKFTQQITGLFQEALATQARAFQAANEQMLQSLTHTLTGVLQSFATSSITSSASEVVAAKQSKKVKKQRLHSDLEITSHPLLASTPFSTTYNSDGPQ